MSKILIIDTSVLCNILNIPGRCQDRQAILDEFVLENELKSEFFVPFGTVLETGNHISKLSDSGLRKKYSNEFAKFIGEATSGKLPLKPINFPGKELMEKSIAEFPINAEQGIGMVDTTIIQEYKECVQLFTGWIVKIWTSDGHLAGYEHYPTLR